MPSNALVDGAQNDAPFNESELPDREELPPGFEGPEKTIEIDFVPHVGPSSGARQISRENWEYILSQARCTILDQMSGKNFDSYLLSESSLFVYPQKVIIKTCGTTTLLRAVVPLIEAAKVSLNIIIFAQMVVFAIFESFFCWTGTGYETGMAWILSQGFHLPGFAAVSPPQYG